MIGFDQELNAISQYLSSNWDPLMATLVLPNEEPPEGNETPFIKLTVQNADGKNLTLGTKAYRYIGVIIIQIFTKSGTGTGLSNEIATALSALFRDEMIDGVIRCKVPVLQNIGVVDSWYQANLSVEFSREEY